MDEDQTNQTIIKPHESRLAMLNLRIFVHNFLQRARKHARRHNNYRSKILRRAVMTDIAILRQDVDDMKRDITDMKSDITDMKRDIADLLGRNDSQDPLSSCTLI
jgi:hypothetical protein